MVFSSQQSLSEKQIKLDLYRTLPSNKHFKLGGTGVGHVGRRGWDRSCDLVGGAGIGHVIWWVGLG